MDLDNIVEIANNPSSQSAPRRQQKPQAQSFTGSVEALDAMFNGAGDGQALQEAFGGQSRADKPYDAYAEMDRMKEGLGESNPNLHLPAGMMESIRRDHALLMETSKGGAMDTFADKLSKKLPGLQAAQDIISGFEKKDEEDKMTAMAAQVTEQRGSSGINYEILKLIIENAVEKSLEKRLSLLSEGVQHGQSADPSVKVLKIGKKFLVLDTEDNVYECSLVLKGKNRKRQS